jgi:hypothetical protein
MHSIIRVDKDDLVFKEEFLFISKIIAMLTYKYIFFINDLSPVIILSDLRLTKIYEGVCGEYRFIVNQSYIAIYPGDPGVTIIPEGISKKVQCITQLHMNITIGDDTVVRFIQVGAVAIEICAVVVHNDIANDPLNVIPDLFVVFPAVCLIQEDPGGFL